MLHVNAFLPFFAFSFFLHFCPFFLELTILIKTIKGYTHHLNALYGDSIMRKDAQIESLQLQMMSNVGAPSAQETEVPSTESTFHRLGQVTTAEKVVAPPVVTTQEMIQNVEGEERHTAAFHLSYGKEKPLPDSTDKSGKRFVCSVDNICGYLFIFMSSCYKSFIKLFWKNWKAIFCLDLISIVGKSS